LFSRKIRITQDVLLKLFNHQFELKVWDTKDKVSAKARFDRPKAFRLPQTKNQDEIDLDCIRSILKQDGKQFIHLGSGSSSLLARNGSNNYFYFIFLFYYFYFYIRIQKNLYTQRKQLTRKFFFTSS